METNNIINIPEGYEIDKEKSNERKIVLKKIEDKRVRSWEEYCEKMKGKASYFYHYNLGETVSSNFDHNPMLSEFEDKKDAEALAAFDKLLKLRKDWISNWKPDWTDSDPKFTIIIEGGRIVAGANKIAGRSMSFPTMEMRDEFIATFKDLLEIAKPLL